VKAYRKTSHGVYDLKYHVVWITKYRRPILRGEVALRARDLIRQTCDALDIVIETGHVSRDHVHLLLSIPPQVSVSEAVRRMKGRSSRLLLQEYAELRRVYWGRHLWARGFFAVSTGNVTEDMVREYIDRHAEENKPPDGSRIHVDEEDV
jgi:putative transposase